MKTRASLLISMEIQWKIGFGLLHKDENLQDFDETIDDNGVTSAFLFTNLAILLKAKAIVRQFLARFAQRC